MQRSLFFWEETPHQASLTALGDRGQPGPAPEKPGGDLVCWWPEAGCGSVVDAPQHALPASPQLTGAAAALNQRELIPH